MFLRTRVKTSRTWIDRRTIPDRRSGMDRRNLFRFETFGAERRRGGLRRTSDWPVGRI